ncbi:hypothetical protein [Nostoc spongiaeforme]|nr:hypothetical protein [Nostoc spongiaeforme]
MLSVILLKAIAQNHFDYLSIFTLYRYINTAHTDSNNSLLVLVY